MTVFLPVLLTISNYNHSCTTSQCNIWVVGRKGKTYFRVIIFYIYCIFYNNFCSHPLQKNKVYFGFLLIILGTAWKTTREIHFCAEFIVFCCQIYNTIGEAKATRHTTTTIEPKKKNKRKMKR